MLGDLTTTYTDIHVNLSKVIGHNGVPNDNLTTVANNPNHTSNTNTYATKISKTNENMSTAPVYDGSNSNTYSLPTNVDLKYRLTSEMSLHDEYSNNTKTNNNNNSNDDVKDNLVMDE